MSRGDAPGHAEVTTHTVLQAARAGSVVPSSKVLTVARLSTAGDAAQFVQGHLARISAEGRVVPSPLSPEGYQITTGTESVHVDRHVREIVSIRLAPQRSKGVVRERAREGSLTVDLDIQSRNISRELNLSPSYLKQWVAKLAVSKELTWRGFWLLGDRHYGAVITSDASTLRAANLAAPNSAAAARARLDAYGMHAPSHLQSLLALAPGAVVARDSVSGVRIRSVEPQGRAGTWSGPRGGWKVTLEAGVDLVLDPRCVTVRKISFRDAPSFEIVLANLQLPPERSGPDQLDSTPRASRLSPSVSGAARFVRSLVRSGAEVTWDAARQNFSIEHKSGRAAVRADGVVLGANRY